MRRVILGLSLLLVAHSSVAAVTDIIPAAGPRGARVILVGSDLGDPTLGVTFAGAGGTRIPALVTERTGTLVEVIVPAAAITGDVMVTGSAPRAFTVTSDPAFVSIATRFAATPSLDLLKRVSGVAVARPGGTVYISDTAHHRVSTMTPSGASAVLAGTGQPGYVDGPGAQAQFKEPHGIAIDTLRGLVYVADSANHVIRKITPDGLVSTLAGSGRPEDADGTGRGASFKNPRGLAVDAAGNVYVADTGNSRIKIVTPSGVVTTIAGAGVEGAVDGPARQALLKQPEGLVVLANGDVIVADTKNHLVRRITNGVLTTIAGTAYPGFTDGAASTAQFSEPAGITADESGALYIADRLNHAVRKLADNVVTMIAGTGKPGYGAVRRRATATTPTGIASRRRHGCARKRERTTRRTAC